MKPEEFEAMKGLDTATLLSFAAERDNPRKRAAEHILELRRAAEISSQAHASPKDSHIDRHGDSWKQKVVVGVVISVTGGLLLLLFKFLFGI